MLPISLEGGLLAPGGTFLELKRQVTEGAKCNPKSNLSKSKRTDWHNLTAFLSPPNSQQGSMSRDWSNDGKESILSKQTSNW
ncbi:unnamed protein product [Protopolystoma xenopodis]|uniref:Uncharacterized protein n=1 Tax=Protopolystoma xenopodis TaxID=117903 RepID=A0A3S5CFI5_9PLAT|nr:unnamed protein product [Protopolystoma xenopodis]